MRVHREFQDPDLVRMLEGLPERAIKARMTFDEVSEENLSAAINAVHAAARQSGVVMSDEEIQAEISASRQERKASSRL